MIEGQWTSEGKNCAGWDCMLPCSADCQPGQGDSTNWQAHPVTAGWPHAFHWLPLFEPSRKGYYRQRLYAEMGDSKTPSKEMNGTLRRSVQAYSG